MANEKREQKRREPGREGERGTGPTQRPGEQPDGGERDRQRGGGRDVSEEQRRAEQRRAE